MTEAETLRLMRVALQSAKQRCYNSKHPDYPRYGARGITVCRRWLNSFEAFVADMGLRPAGLTLERKNNNRGYSKANCVWATRAQQANNKHNVKLVSWEGVTRTVAEWERHKGFKPGTLKARFLLGYTVKQAMTKAVKCGGLEPSRTYAPRKKPYYDPKRRGLAHPGTKLSQFKVLRMRQLAAKGESFSALGRLFGVSVTTASNAVQFKGAYSDV